jgi:hypothetical protein
MTPVVNFPPVAFGEAPCLEYLLEFSEKFEMALRKLSGAQGKMIDERT